MSKAKDLDHATRKIRMCFQLLKTLGDRLCQDLNITASMRAVIEQIDEGGPQTVPQIARAKNVSRQHIQLLVDALGEAGMIILKPNPAHRRSSLVELTDAGAAAFWQIREKEAILLQEIAQQFKRNELEQANAFLLKFADQLKQIMDLNPSSSPLNDPSSYNDPSFYNKRSST